MTTFTQVLDEMDEMHQTKQADYGRPKDPLANIRASEDFGIPPWVGALVRGNDKMRRLMKAAQGGTLRNESVEDSLLDLAVYTVISLVLFREGQGVPEPLLTVEEYAEQIKDQPYDEPFERDPRWWDQEVARLKVGLAEAEETKSQETGRIAFRLNDALKAARLSKSDCGDDDCPCGTAEVEPGSGAAVFECPDSCQALEHRGPEVTD